MPPINLTPLSQPSSAITATGYDATTQTLAILFKGSPTPKYFANVPQSVHEALRDAESAGRFYHQHIKGAYPTPAPPADDEGASPD